MDHVVYVDAKAREMEQLIAGEKTMIIRGATGRKIPHGRVNSGDVLYFINNNAEGLVKAFEIEPFKIDKSNYGNMDDWLPVGEIGTVKS